MMLRRCFQTVQSELMLRKGRAALVMEGAVAIFDSDVNIRIKTCKVVLSTQKIGAFSVKSCPSTLAANDKTS